MTEVVAGDYSVVVDSVMVVDEVEERVMVGSGADSAEATAEEEDSETVAATAGEMEEVETPKTCRYVRWSIFDRRGTPVNDRTCIQRSHHYESPCPHTP